MKNWFPYLLIAFLALPAFVNAQSTNVPIYTVQVGNFINAKYSDFEGIHSFGYLYSEATNSNMDRILLGGYNDRSVASRIVMALKERGYVDAFVHELPTQTAQVASVIQLGVYDVRDQGKINWKKYSAAGRLFVVLNNNQVKILAGTYPNLSAAQAILPTIRRKGFQDAFVKNVNSALLHEVTTFQTGKMEPVRIEEPVAIVDVSPTPPPSTDVLTPRDVPTSAGADDQVIITNPPVEETKGTPETPQVVNKLTTPKPFIRDDVKRTSAIELQKILKQKGFYEGSLDGLYGKGTRAAYEKSIAANRQINKYRLLAQYEEKNVGEDAGTIQYAVNHLWDNTANANFTLERSDSPTAKAYRAYSLFMQQGDQATVNNLMNAAIKGAFVDKKVKNAPRFDYTATYAYNDLNQLLLHLRYVQSAVGDVGVPCWLFERHPTEALQAFGSGADDNLKFENCGGFLDWEETQILNAMTNDLNAGQPVDAEQATDLQAQQVRLFLTPIVPSKEEKMNLEAWHKSLRNGINAWASRDPLNEEIGTAFQINYLQTEVLLEDHFMNKGFSERDAKTLAIAALKAILGGRLDRFV